MRRLLLALALLLAAPAAAAAGPGFTVPSGNTTCGILAEGDVEGARAGLYCYSSYFTSGPRYDGVGVVRLGRTGKAKRAGAGNDLLLAIGGWEGEDAPRSPRPVLGYRERFERRGYTCTNRRTGLTCRRGAHGFFLLRESRRLF